MAQTQSNKNPKTQGAEKNFDNDLGANNPVKKEGLEKRDSRKNSFPEKQRVGSQKFREESVSTGRQDQTAR